MTQIFFDDALPTLAKILDSHYGSDFVEQGTFLRDTSGRLTFLAGTSQPIDQQAVDEVTQKIVEGLQSYAHPDRTVVYVNEDNMSSLLDSSERIPMQVDGKFCYLIDRRIVGTGWLAEPTSTMASPPRLVFASLKGGVGRSTALTVIAADLARRGKNVLVVDLDLEAPGLGHILLKDERLPVYGVIDFLVENGVGGVKDEQLRDFIGTSQLTDASGGRVDVMPALGQKSAEMPENVLAKLSRAMIEDITDAGDISVGQQVSTMIERIVANGSYDAVLVDSRAGLAELAAPAITGLGATVLLFGTAQTQTFEGYRALFAALKLLAQRDGAQNRSADWRLGLRPVYAKASLIQDSATRFQDEFYELYSEYLYDAEIEGEPEAQLNSLRYARDEITAPHHPLIIPFSQAFVDFDPTQSPNQLTNAFYEQTFRAFLNEIDKILAPTPAGTQS